MPQTPYKGYEVQTTGSNSGTWGSTLNDDMISIADRNIGGIHTESLSSSNVVLTAEQSQNLILRLTGTLTANVEITATSFEGMMIVENVTTGSFTTTFTDGVSGTVIPQGARSLVIADTSNGTRIAAGTFPTGTRMIFQQTTAPVGWTKESSSTYNNAALRFVTGSISTGGSVDFTTAFASQTPTGTVGDTTLTIAQMPLHGHPFRLSIDNGQSSETNGGLIMAGDNQANQSAYTGTPSATVGQQIGGTGGGGSHTHTLVMNAVNLAVKYADCIIAQKD